ncbi:thylakoid lumenal 16.5 kDa protein [Pyrus ussuriensis x Pyrus communis]|uniref:Thylakoid lumenal 16.5 kDa protein n=1 Tax=Pyrus ussuriensis x Pyrus communis TaxID=2448454 RepID=A0A5N5H633_9ROSA|nr:thylakoid lumenal 16.5 kDa protein, chloroplastic [Pyrus x bretschneideri]KAB2618614.1 thylakoid lumenal 16.5 kDa protein [Pyrus ussuriensis x Pyrus communis]
MNFPTKKIIRKKKVKKQSKKMATAILSTAKSFLPSTLSSSASSVTSSSSLTTPPTLIHVQKTSTRRGLTFCKALSEEPHSPAPILTKRSLSICFLTSFAFSLVGKDFNSSNAAILEADDDEELLEKVKKDRKKRLERQGVLSSSKKETGYLQELVYRLSKAGQAIESNDLPAASSVLGASTDTDWVQKANLALNKLSSSPEEKTEVDTFNSSLASLISSVTRNDVESSKLAFVSSASAIEKWTTLTGLIDQLKGL